MRYRDTQQSLKALYSVAATQGGYFTAKQAAEAGYDYSHLVYHLQAGNFERAAHGLYRLPTIPLAEHDDLIRLSLWSRGHDDIPKGIVSHVSAMFLHQLSDVLPSKVHLTVPSGFRKVVPRGCVLHKSRLTAAETEAHEGFAVTKPLRTLLDATRDSSITDEQLERAVHDAISRGLVRESVLKRELGKVMLPTRRDYFASLVR